MTALQAACAVLRLLAESSGLAKGLAFTSAAPSAAALARFRRAFPAVALDASGTVNLAAHVSRGVVAQVRPSGPSPPCQVCLHACIPLLLLAA